jgi:hypothetical protein
MFHKNASLNVSYSPYLQAQLELFVVGHVIIRLALSNNYQEIV